MNRLDACVLLMHYRLRLNSFTAQSRETQERVEVILRQLEEQKKSELANRRKGEWVLPLVCDDLALTHAKRSMID
jgi:hypothetical protein